jgi:hypothetical protein
LSKYKRNHFVASSIVAQFCGPNKQVRYWDKLKGEVLEPRNPSSVHYVDHLYATWDIEGRRDVEAEKFLDRDIDTHSKGKIEEIIESYKKTGSFALSDDHRNFLVKLLVRTVMRNPTVINHVTRLPAVRMAMFFDGLSRLVGRGRKEDKAYTRYGKERVLLGKIASSMAMFDVSRVRNDLSSRGFHFYIPTEGSRNFVLGSQPFLINTVSQLQKKSRILRTDLLSRNNEVYLVIHPRVMLKVYGGQDSEYPIAMDDEDMKRVNGLFVKYSNSVVAVNAMDLDGVWYKDFGKEESDEKCFVTITSAP